MSASNEHAPASSQLAQGANQNRPRNSTKFTPRLHRLASALLERPRAIRDLIDVIPTNNPAEYVKQLRRCHGLSIPCQWVKFTTCDGEKSRLGIYHVTESDAAVLQELVSRAHE